MEWFYGFLWGAITMELFLVFMVIYGQARRQTNKGYFCIWKCSATEHCYWLPDLCDNIAHKDNA